MCPSTAPSRSQTTTLKPVSQKERLMFTKIKNWINAEVTSVETILAGWTKVIKDLENHAAAQMEAAWNHRQVSEIATQAEAAAKAEAAKAVAAADKLKAVVA